MKPVEHQSIDPNREVSPAGDYEFLRKEGLRHIRELAAQTWTDHNLHDPGITMLELLSYGITDLAYRTGFTTEELLTPPGKTAPETKDSFYKAAEILPSHPVTPHDYRKLLIDRVPCLKNVWIEKTAPGALNPQLWFNKKTRQHSFTQSDSSEAVEIKGLFTVIADLDSYENTALRQEAFLNKLAGFRPENSTPSAEKITKEEYKTCCRNYIFQLLAGYRNVDEDIFEVRILDDEWVGVCADIELTPQAKPATVLLEIQTALSNFIHPWIPLYSWPELENKGRPMEQIFDGPLPVRGFVDDEELDRFERQTALYTSDLVNLLHDIDGVRSVRDLTLNSYRYEQLARVYQPLKTNEKTRLTLVNPASSAFRFAPGLKSASSEILHRFNFYKGAIYFSPQLANNQEFARRTRQRLPEKFTTELPVPEGKYRNLNRYYTVQNDFPAAYLTGRGEVPASLSTLRKAQRLQLKGYLLFFDQLFADYLEQLNNLRNLFSWKESSWDPTYSQHRFNDSEISDFSRLFTSYHSYKHILEEPDIRKERRNRLLDHLLARFNENFVDYSLVKFRQSSGGLSYRNYSASEIIHDKVSLLNNYPEISGQRSHSLNYLEPRSKNNRLTLEKRLLRIFGIDHANLNVAEPVTDSDGNLLTTPEGEYRFYDNRLARFDRSFGFLVIEHLLLRPLANRPSLQLFNPCSSGQSCHCADPFSLQLTVVVPGWLAVSSRMEFRRFAEEKIRLEAPAHLALKICWVSPDQFYLLEKGWNEFLGHYGALRNPANPVSEPLLAAWEKSYNAVSQILSSLKNIYPASTLNSCNDMQFDASGEPLQTPVILDHSALAGGDDVNYVFEKKP